MQNVRGKADLLLAVLKYLNELCWSYDIWLYREMTYIPGNQQRIFGFSLRHCYSIEATVFGIGDLSIIRGCIGNVQTAGSKSCQNGFSQLPGDFEFLAGKHFLILGKDFIIYQRDGFSAENRT